MELEEHYGYRSTFFFLALKNALSIEGRKYSYKDPKVRRVIRKLDDVGWEVALHGSRYNNENLDYLVIQKDRIEQILGKEIDGCRHHWLRVLFPSSWHLYGNAGFKYSSNMGWYHPYNGFRAGTCFPYWPLDGSEKRGEGILEIPFQLMDENSIEKPDDYLNLFSTYIERVKSVGGCLVINFHQEYFDESQAAGVNGVYCNILSALSEDEEIEVLTLKEVYNILHKKRQELIES